MKKNFILLLMCLLVAFSTAAQKQNNKWSRWSITLEGGVNRFDGDVQQKWDHVLPTAFNKLTIGGGLEYTPLPAWTVGVDYNYLPLAALNKGKEGDPNFIIADFKGTMHNVALFTGINFIKAFSPKSLSKWGIWLNLGVGYAWYHSVYKTDRHGTASTDGHGQKYIDFNDDFHGKAIYFPVVLLLEYNLSKSFALGVKTQFRGYNKDYLEQRIQHGVTNDNIQMATLQLRYKFGAHCKDHTRNVNTAKFTGTDITKDDLDNLQRKIDAIVIPGPDPRIDELDNRLRKVEDYLDIDGPDDDNDGVANGRDREPNTPEGTQVDFWGRAITAAAAPVVYDPVAFIFFDFDKTNLDEEAHTAIRIAADKLKADPNLLVEVRGFTDNMGTDAYNASLSQRRADKVKNELVTRYGIEPDRIVANGKGKYNPEDKVMPFRPYRTAAFFYSK